MFGTSPFSSGELTDKVRLSPYGVAGGDSHTGVLEPSSGAHHANDIFSESNKNDMLVERALEEERKKKMKARLRKKKPASASNWYDSNIRLATEAFPTEQQRQDANTVNDFYDQQIDQIEEEIDRSGYDEFDMLDERKLFILTNFMQDAVRMLQQRYPAMHVTILGKMAAFSTLSNYFARCEQAKLIGDVKVYCADGPYAGAIEKLKGVVMRILEAIRTSISEVVEGSVSIEEVSERLKQTESPGLPAPRRKPSWQRMYIPGLSQEWQRELNKATRALRNLRTAQFGSGGSELPIMDSLPTGGSGKGDWVADTARKMHQEYSGGGNSLKAPLETVEKSTVTIEAGNASEGEVGSGFFIADNVIVTCAHVVTPNGQSPEYITIKIHGKEYEGALLAADQEVDLAAISVADQQFRSPSHLMLGDSANVDMGEEVMVLGTPFGFENVLQTGIVSSKPVTYSEEQGDFSYIFISAQINPGNSGGPVVLKGDSSVIGIAAATISDDQGSSGLNATIPVDIAKDFLKRNGIKWNQ